MDGMLVVFCCMELSVCSHAFSLWCIAYSYSVESSMEPFSFSAIEKIVGTALLRLIANTVSLGRCARDESCGVQFHRKSYV
jgi:hypothetical protein